MAKILIVEDNALNIKLFCDLLAAHGHQPEAVTAYSARGDEERIRAAGAQAYVSKPISVVRFAQTVDELLESGEQADPTGEAQSEWANEGAEGPGLGEPGGEES